MAVIVSGKLTANLAANVPGIITAKLARNFPETVADPEPRNGMGYPPRIDPPDSWHHVSNRGQARRAIFPAEHEARLFQAALARAVRHTGIQIHAYALMTTHYHLLVWSPGDALAAAIGLAQSWFVRRFNLRHGRDGALFNRRYWSRRLHDLSDRIIVARYIDANPVTARITELATDYPWCSAYHYARQDGPPWLTRTWVEYIVGGPRGYRPESYEAWSQRNRNEACWLAERRLQVTCRTAAGSAEPPAVSLSTPLHLQEWLDQNARRADGSPLRWPLASPERVLTVLAQLRIQLSTGKPSSRIHPWSAWMALTAGFLRSVCSLSHREAAAIQGIPIRSFQRAVALHSRLLREDPSYAEMAKLALSACLAADDA